ncbi:MAG: hypothetical protein JW958_11235 [Candidatus Eisenbacteria bacterium]|nr:hypothetical protein [Candidatus Eisenbacteria bacterium]
MRVEQGAPFLDPTRENGRAEDAKKKADKASSRKGGRDTVQISKEARDLQAGRTGSGDGAEAVRSSSDGNRMEQIVRRLESGFYDRQETCLALADELMEAFGI